jgi:hypothetical protein
VPVRLSAIVRSVSSRAFWISSILLGSQLAVASAQDDPTLPIRPLLPFQAAPAIQTSSQVKPTSPSPAAVSDDLELRGGLVCGGGASTSSAGTRPTTQCGALLGLGFLETEAGVMGPQANRSAVSGYLSENLWIPLRPRSTHGSVVALGGYTRMFETGHAVDYGLAYVKPIGRVGDMRYVQLEARDYWAFANPSQHNVVFRVVWLFGGGDEP